MSSRSAAWNMSGYLSGLSSPSVTDRMTTLCASPRSKAAGQTRLPTFSISSRLPSAGSSRSSARRTMSASRWQPLPVLIWIAGAPVARMRSASRVVCWSPSITATVDAALQRLDGLHQQRRLARTGAGHEVEREDAAVGQALAVGRGDGVVLGQDVLLDLHQARRRHARRVGTERGSGGCVVSMRRGRGHASAVGMLVPVPAAVACSCMAVRVIVHARACVCSCAWVSPSTWFWSLPQPQVMHMAWLHFSEGRLKS